MPFIKGQSAHPKGSDHKFNTREARQFTRFCQLAAKKYGWRILDKLLKSNDLDKQRYALDVVMERGFGKPIQINQNENWDMTPENVLTDEQLRTKAREILQKEADADFGSTPRIGSDNKNSGISPIQ